MAGVDGEWACVTETPMGAQPSVLSVVSEGDRFTGVNAGAMGSLEVIDGRIEGNVLRWQMALKAPFPITLHATATIDGDSLDGEVVMGAFGSGKMTGTRKG